MRFADKKCYAEVIVGQAKLGGWRRNKKPVWLKCVDGSPLSSCKEAALAPLQFRNELRLAKLYFSFEYAAWVITDEPDLGLSFWEWPHRDDSVRLYGERGQVRWLMCTSIFHLPSSGTLLNNTVVVCAFYSLGVNCRGTALLNSCLGSSQRHSFVQLGHLVVKMETQ